MYQNADKTRSKKDMDRLLTKYKMRRDRRSKSDAGLPAEFLYLTQHHIS